VTRIALVGAGLMGSQIGCEYALAGCEVVWVVRDRAAAQARIDRALALVRHHGLADAASVDLARGLMRFGGEQGSGGEPSPGGEPSVGGRPNAAEDAPDVIVESLPEDLALKADVLRPLLAARPDAVLATNTSSIAISALGEAAGAAERIVGTHYWNPPLLMPLVEVVAGERTPVALRDRLAELLRTIGKRPVLLEREVPGLLWNRLQSAMLRECLWLVEHGVATPETIDEVMRDGLARRWRLTGPFETVGLGGAQTFDAIAANLFPLLSDATGTSGFEPHVPHDPRLLAELRERRDEALAATLRHERDAGAGGGASP
jgi:3-hydroxybutyryl-CoA dehydrogenase